MYSIHSGPDGRLETAESVSTAPAKGLILHLQENRSHLSQEARVAFTSMVVLFMAVAILPALKGHWLVPLLSLASMGALVAAIEWHKQSCPADEWLTVENGRLLYRYRGYEPLDLPVSLTHLVEEQSGPCGLRLFLESQWRRFEIGTCLSLDEKRAVAPVIARILREGCP